MLNPRYIKKYMKLFDRKKMTFALVNALGIPRRDKGLLIWFPVEIDCCGHTDATIR